MIQTQSIVFALRRRCLTGQRIDITRALPLRLVELRLPRHHNPRCVEFRLIESCSKVETMITSTFPVASLLLAAGLLFAAGQPVPAASQDTPPAASEPANLLKPANETESWTHETSGDGKGTMEVDGDAIVFTTTATSSENWHVQAYQKDLDLKDGTKYTLTFQAKSPDSVSVLVVGMIHQEDWHEIGLHEEIFCGKEYREHKFTFTAQDTVESKNRIGFVMGVAKGIVSIKDVKLTAEAPKEIKVTLTEMHLCCSACVSAVQKAVSGVEGVTATVSEDDSSTVLVATDRTALKKAVDAIGAAGFHGASDDKNVQFAAVKLPEGKVARLELTGVHNCCGGCLNAVKEAVEGVEGVKTNSLKAKQTSFVAEGDFSAKALVDALNAAGFHVAVKE